RRRSGYCPGQSSVLQIQPISGPCSLVLGIACGAKLTIVEPVLADAALPEHLTVSLVDGRGALDAEHPVAAVGETAIGPIEENAVIAAEQAGIAADGAMDRVLDQGVGQVVDRFVGHPSSRWVFTSVPLYPCAPCFALRSPLSLPWRASRSRS